MATQILTVHCESYDSGGCAKLLITVITGNRETSHFLCYVNWRSAAQLVRSINPDIVPDIFAGSPRPSVARSFLPRKVGGSLTRVFSSSVHARESESFQLNFFLSRESARRGEGGGSGMQARSSALLRVVVLSRGLPPSLRCLPLQQKRRGRDYLPGDWSHRRVVVARPSLVGFPRESLLEGGGKRRGKTDGAPREDAREREEGWVFPLPRLFDPGALRASILSPGPSLRPPPPPRSTSHPDRSLSEGI